ncbi:MAG: hypothetical protein QOE89_192 [Pseudonocardiales bacterium]|jgi:uncharacterized membrane protein YphA (DoxX/SURF4 family)|nr:hypothetical protein [Pseudonocardiales bacterium]
MSVIRAVARPLLAATFVVGGIDTLRKPANKTPAAEKVVGGLADRAPQLSSTEDLVKLDAAVKVVAGTMLALGKFPRLSSLALAASLVPTTFAGHRFWEETDPTKRSAQQLHFLKNAGMLGGLILASVDTEGRPSLVWRARRAPEAVKHAADDLRRDAELDLRSARRRARGAVKGLHGHGQPALRTAAETLRGTAAGLRSEAQPVIESATEVLREAALGVRHDLQPALSEATQTLRATAADVKKHVAPVVRSAGEALSR